MLNVKLLIASACICQQIRFCANLSLSSDVLYPTSGSGTSYADYIIGCRNCKHESRLCSAICWDSSCHRSMCLYKQEMWPQGDLRLRITARWFFILIFQCAQNGMTHYQIKHIVVGHIPLKAPDPIWTLQLTKGKVNQYLYRRRTGNTWLLTTFKLSVDSNYQRSLPQNMMLQQQNLIIWCMPLVQSQAVWFDIRKYFVGYAPWHYKRTLIWTCSPDLNMNVAFWLKAHCAAVRSVQWWCLLLIRE